MGRTVITSDPRHRWGAPCIGDTGVSVASIVSLHRAGYSTVRILDAIPVLHADDVDQALEWHGRFGDDHLGPKPPPPGERYPRVAVDPGVQGGEPVIRGTRITVDAICGLAAEGWTIEEILTEYPSVAPGDVADALAYDRAVRPA